MENQLNAGHRARLRTRYIKAGGCDGFPDYDLVELLMTYALPRRDVKPIARELLHRFKDIGGIMDADISKLCEIEGIGETSALLIKLMRDFCTRYLESKVHEADVLSSTEAVKSYARMKLAGNNEEVLMVLFLDTKNRLICSEIASHGTVDSAVIYPRNIVEDALRNKASSVIIIHNHPSGVTDPSSADRRFTRQVQEALRALSIRLLDHLIVSRYSSYSFLDHGILEQEL